MKGIAHFVTGVAIATLFPEVVERAANGSILPVLGGIAGILPDTLDFKVLRYFERYDVEIDPAPSPDPGDIADQLAETMHRAYESGEPQAVMLHTIRLGPDRWRRYTVRFDPPDDRLTVRIGPVVDTGQRPFPDSEPRDAAEARARIGVPLVHTCDDEIAVDIFSGPSFKLERQDDRLRINFLDWHRRWSHSLTMVAALGLSAAGIAALANAQFGAATSAPLWTGLVVGLGLLAHVLQDQLGCMGSNLLFPLTQERTPGLGLLRSGDAIPNVLTVWTALMLILLNLDRFSAYPRLDPRQFLGVAVALPVAIIGGIYQSRWRRRELEALRQQDILSEVEDVEVG